MALYKRSTADMDYVTDELGINPASNPDQYSQCLDTMAQYDTPWWKELSGDPIALANCQIDQPVLLIPWSVFKTGVEKVLKRKLAEGELSSSNEELIKEFHKKYAEL